MTRYPASGKGSSWTTLELKNICADSAGIRLAEPGGLVGEVRVSSTGVVTIPFKYAFKWQKKLTWFYCGMFPHESISVIRKNRDNAKHSLSFGIDPRAQKKADILSKQNEVKNALSIEAKAKEDEVAAKIANLNFIDLYNVWIKDGVSRADNNKYIIQSFSKHALPELGKVEVKNLSEHHLRNLYRKIIDSGKISTATELSKDIKQMLRWAEKRQPWRKLLIDGNPAELIEFDTLVPHSYSKIRTRLLSPDEIQKLASIFKDSESSYSKAYKKYEVDRPLKKEVQLAMWICLSSLCRIGELLKTEWKDVDFDKRTWFIPSENVKGQRNSKRSQLVYLSEFTLTQFKQLHELTGQSRWVFPARYKDDTHVCVKSASKQIGDRQVKFKRRTKKLKDRVENNSLVLSEVGEWTPHDLRRTGATMMQKLKIHRDVINLCQNHVIGSKVDRVYLHDDYAEEKFEAWNKLGIRINEILDSVTSLQD